MQRGEAALKDSGGREEEDRAERERSREVSQQHVFSRSSFLQMVFNRGFPNMQQSHEASQVTPKKGTRKKPRHRKKENRKI